MKRLSFAGFLLAAVVLFTGFFNNSYAENKSCCNTKCCSMECCKTDCSACCADGKCSMNCCNTENGMSGGNQNDSLKGSTETPTETSGKSTCAVSGESFTSGKGIKYSYLGKEYEFCCDDCLSAFKKEPIKYDAHLICPIMGEAASKDASVEYNGTKYYFCCNPCINKFNKDPEKYSGGYKE